MAAQERSVEDRAAGVTLSDTDVSGEFSPTRTDDTTDEAREPIDTRWIDAMRDRLRRATGPDETFVWTDEGDGITAGRD